MIHAEARRRGDLARTKTRSHEEGRFRAEAQRAPMVRLAESAAFHSAMTGTKRAVAHDVSASSAPLREQKSLCLRVLVRANPAAVRRGRSARSPRRGCWG